MNTREILKILTDAGVEENEAKIELEMLAEHFCSYTVADRIKGISLNNAQLEILKEKVELRAKERLPIQYIIGHTVFCGKKFKVNENVLIPRDETEILVNIALGIIKENNFKTVLDIGTGSGCIACTIAKKSDTVVMGTDISTDALRIALDNVTSLGINNKAVFRKSDLFSSVRDDERFDLIVSNPPYIPNGTNLQEEVKHEPPCALFADENGLSFYRRILEHAPQYMNKGGYIIFELGIGESEAVKEFMKKCFDNITVIKDFAGIDRVVYGRLKS